VVAFKSLEAGEATPYQQQRVLNLIIKNFARTYDLPFIPGQIDQSAFLAGRAYVGHSIMRHINMPASTLDKLHDPSKNPSEG